jgi:hypothetical protein
MQLDLTDEETATLTRLLTNTIDADRYPLSPRIQTLKGILGKIRPEPAREPLPPLRRYELAREGGARLELPPSGPRVFCNLYLFAGIHADEPTSVARPAKEMRRS